MLLLGGVHGKACSVGSETQTDVALATLAPLVASGLACLESEMAAVTAAVVAGVATVAATGMQVAQSQGAFGKGGGGGGSTTTKPMPEDPQDEAMKNYFGRTVVANADKTYPSFGAFLESGGDPALAKFDLDMPGLKPSEAAALGFTGGKGEAIPYMPQDVAEAGGAQLTPAQILYLAKERARTARSRGEEPSPWAKKVNKMGGRIGRLEKRLEEKFTPTPEVEPRETKIIKKLEKLRGKQEALLNPQAPVPPAGIQ